MKYILLLALSVSVMTSCTLTPRNSKGRTLNPDRETMTPDQMHPDSAVTDSIR